MILNYIKLLNIEFEEKYYLFLLILFNFLKMYFNIDKIEEVVL